MKIKTLVAVLLLSGGVTSTFAQTENCNSNSSISHEAVRAGNFKDAYAPCMAVLKDCPTLRYYTFTDAQKILVGFLSQIKDRNSADYKKYFDELMDVYDLRMKYIPEFIGKGMKGVPSVADALGAKAVDYLQFAPAPDLNTAYNWLKESVHAEKGGSKGAVLHYFLDTSMQKVKADDNHTDQFFQDYIDASTLKTPEELEEAILKYTVFGRVTPDQKRQFVQALKKNGKTVAMTGDGVNDVLALKDADCSVAMASGSDAAAQAAQLVLLDNDFSKMPSVVLEGRRVVNNLQRSGTLFLVKNIFSFLLSIFSLISMVTYPLEPSQISLISMFTIGIPGFLLSLMPNKNRIEGHFITNILTRALPAALTDFLMVATLVVFGQEFAVGSEDISTAATVLLAIVGFMILYRISKPLNWMRWTILIGSIIAFIFCSTYLNQLFAISDMSRKCIMLLVVFSVATEPVLRYLSILVDSISSFYRKQKIFFLRKREARKAK